MPGGWKEAIIIPLHNKGDKTDCSNYKAIFLLNTAYRVFSMVLLSRLIPFAEEFLGEYQCGFRIVFNNGKTLDNWTFGRYFWTRKKYNCIHRESMK
jgi:sorting nexin-29